MKEQLIHQEQNCSSVIDVFYDVIDCHSEGKIR